MQWPGVHDAVMVFAICWEHACGRLATRELPQPFFDASTGMQVLRQGFWPSFIKDICRLICGAGLLNEQLCCNSMVLFSLVCEKVCNFPLR